MMPKYKEFDVMTVSLQSSNLIEASAGTGKTYSIAILALRLLLEKKIPIQEILMVTFTKAAVAELEERIREFIRNAWRYTQGEDISDTTIKSVVDKYGMAQSAELLRPAIINLDETKVMTIHGFCQQTLNEFAFEAGQLFNTELIQDTTKIIEREIQDFWRKKITTLDKELLAILIEKTDLKQEHIYNIIQGHLSGKKYIFYDEANKNKYNLDDNKQQELLQNIDASKVAIQAFEDEFASYLKAQKPILNEIFEKSKLAKNAFEDLVDEPIAFLNLIQIHIKKGTNYAQKYLSIFFEYADKYQQIQQSYSDSIEDAMSYIYAVAIDYIVPRTEAHKRAYSLVSFDDMIEQLHSALDDEKDRENNFSLSNKLAGKYKAVFIDEFQDTDKIQYDIFQMAFDGKSILFYIGDPKQSIYAFRRADIATYLKARDHVPNLYSMNTNYRSTNSYIQALNQFFLPEEDFDTFHFENENERIVYHKVNAPTSDSKNVFLKGESACPPLIFQFLSNQDEINQSVKNTVLELLTDESYTIYDTNLKAQRRIRPSDIGILIRTNNRASQIKVALSKSGIPAVTVADTKILQSDEAKDMAYLLEAVLQPTQSNIRRALTTGFIRYDANKILTLNDEKAVQSFREYFGIWKKDGIYFMLMTIIAQFDIQTNLLQTHAENGERILTNLMHLAEIIYKTANRRHFEPAEVLDWLKVNIEKAQSTDDEWQQRIENDEDAVKIVTIHKSKGLQYPIVFAPDLDFSNSTSEKSRIISFRNDNGEYVTARYAQLSTQEQNLFSKQQEQENRRLLYVALTRAKYSCYIFKSNSSKSSTLSYFTEPLKYNDLIVQYTKDEQPNTIKTYKAERSERQEVLKPKQFSLREINWAKISYSRLAGDHAMVVSDHTKIEMTGYDHFIFNTLPKGSKTGNFLHAILERLDFTNAENWKYIIKQVSGQYYPNADLVFLEAVKEMLDHVINTGIPVIEESIKLADVPFHQCLHELEFDYPFSSFNAATLTTLRKEGIAIKSEFNDYSGFMNGKVDLFFEHNGKYYILDWKSNHLGNTISDYAADKIATAMSANNYHLQYLIYTYAVQKYLRFKLPHFDYKRDFGGVIYLFVRGIRQGTTNGIFYQKPTMEQVKKMEKVFGNGALI